MRKNAFSFLTLIGVIVALSLSCEAAYYSNLTVTNVLIRNDGHDTNLRVLVANTGGGALHHQPYQLRLLIRHNGDEAFRLLKTWNEENLKAGQELALDYFSAAGPDDSALHESHYEVRGEVWAEGTLLNGKNSSI